MADQAEPLRLLARALDQAADLIKGIKPEQADLRTPCRSWTVHHLVAHLVADLGNFAARVRGEKPDWGRQTTEIGDDWAGAFATARRGLDDAWARPETGGAENPPATVDQQLAELGVHAWDLARATGQSEDLDPDVADHGLRWARQNLAPQFRGSEEDGKAFGEEVPVAADAPVYERLAGWFGRDPAWSA